MTTINLTYEIRGFGKYAYMLNNIARMNVLRRIGHAFIDVTRDSMGAERPMRPAPWPPLSKAYAKRVKPPVPTLWRSGRLMNSIGMVASENSLKVFSSSPYAAVHQFGGGNHIPARPYFPIESAGVGSWQLTPYAQARIDEAAGLEVARVFNQSVRS